MLGGGADCGPMNPLQGAMKGTNADWSLQRDRFVSSSSAAAGPSTSQQQQANEAEQFYKQQPFDLATLGQQLPPQNQHQSAAWNASFSRALPATRRALLVDSLLVIVLKSYFHCCRGLPMD